MYNNCLKAEIKNRDKVQISTSNLSKAHEDAWKPVAVPVCR